MVSSLGGWLLLGFFPPPPPPPPSEFGAKEKELEKLEFMTRTNPMNPKGPPMRLFLRFAVSLALGFIGYFLMSALQEGRA